VTKGTHVWVWLVCVFRGESSSPVHADCQDSDQHSDAAPNLCIDALESPPAAGGSNKGSEVTVRQYGIHPGVGAVARDMGYSRLGGRCV
jgi:hypothetical protein